MDNIPDRRRNPQRIAVHKTRLRANRTAVLFQRYWEDDGFKMAFHQFLASHCDVLGLIARLHPDEISLSLNAGIRTFYDPDRPWCTLPTDPNDAATLKDYERDVRSFLTQWELHRLSGDRGYDEMHTFSLGVYRDLVRCGTSDRWLGCAVFEAAEREPLPLVGEVIGHRTREWIEPDGTRRWKPSSITRPRVHIEMVDQWDVTNEPWEDAEKRLKKVFARLLRQEMNRVLSMEEGKGYVVADTADRENDAIDWFFHRFVLHYDVEVIAEAASLSVRTIQNRTNDLARSIGFCTPKNRKRTF